MSMDFVFSVMKKMVNRAPRDHYSVEMHVQMLKYADLLEGMTGKEFCDRLGVPQSWSSEFAKMKKLAPRLREAGLDLSKL